MQVLNFTRQGAVDCTLSRHKSFRFLLGPIGFGLSRNMRFIDTNYTFADPRAQTIWSTQVYVYGLQNNFFTGLMGKDKNSLIVVDTELQDKPGGTIIVESRQPITGAGVGNDGNTTGKEAQIKKRNMSVIIGQRANATVSAGALSEQLTSSVFREDSKVELGTWISEAMEDDIATSAAGLYNVNSSSSEITTINESYPTSDRIYYGGQDATGSLGNSGVSYGTDALLTGGTQGNNLMGTVIMESIKRRMVAAVPRMRPVFIRDLTSKNPDDVRSNPMQGPILMKTFIVLMHSLQIKAIKAETGTIGFKAMVSAAQLRGNLNPILSGASFYWDGMLVFEYDRIPLRAGAGLEPSGAGTGTLAEGFLLNAGRTETTDPCAADRTVARALFMGGQAMSFAWAKRPTWSEDFVDNDIPKVKTNMIYGVKRVNFNAHGTTNATSDEAIFCLDTEVLVDA